MGEAHAFSRFFPEAIRCFACPRASFTESFMRNTALARQRAMLVLILFCSFLGFYAFSSDGKWPNQVL
ncbi:MAG: hypothetical protein EBS82_03795 [Methylocystaceae bacterium]|jgi:hypothetical protein|nr:hypothetical protein [Methylocystaceae bacterium]NBT97069.1 hypothetical protein [Methylocystaceae bacterium]